MSQGIDYVSGVPGANVKKADWIQKLDELKPKRIYILYDADRVGQKAAQELAERIGIEHCWKIVLPPFKKQDGEDGKDINEWFAAGHTLEEFEELKRKARNFAVSGVLGAADALDELEEDFLNGTTEAKYVTKYLSLNSKIGGFNPGDVIDISALAKHGKTTWVMNILEDLVLRYNESAFLYCLEMPVKRMARKWASHVTLTDDTPGQSKMTVDVIRAAKEYARSREAELLFGYSTVRTPDEVYDKIRQVVRRYGAKFVCFDNLQLLCDKTLT
jgi:5S rRNA maturation endonuclease (ribonuclease M5)